MKRSILENVGISLLSKGFTIKTLTRTCFDLVARKGKSILLIKVLQDANSVSKEYTTEMTRVASYISASPVIIAESAQEKLKDNVVYARFGIYTVNLNTFVACLSNNSPFIKSDHAGLMAHVIGGRLKEAREKDGKSLGDIASKIGVTKSMVQRYESGKSDVGVGKALRIYDSFGSSVFEKIDIFSSFDSLNPEMSLDITKKYKSLGFDASETKKVPFDIIAKKEKEIILTMIGDEEQPQLDAISKLIDADKLAIFRKKKPKNIPAVTKEEFMEFEKAWDLIKFVKEFS